MENLEGILAVIKKNSQDLKLMKVRRLSVFGSFARGEQKNSRDVDLVVQDALRADFRVKILKDMIRAAEDESFRIDDRIQAISRIQK